MKNIIPIQTDIAIFSILAILFTMIYFALPVLCLYDNDSGVKHIEMKAFQINQWKDYEIRYPGKSLGLDFKDLNMPEFFIGRKAKLLGPFYLAFPFLSSLFYPFLGERVIHFLPLISFFFSILLFSLTLRLLKPNRPLYYLSLFGFIFASPLYLYSLTFSEHLPLVFLISLSLYFLVRFFMLKPSALNLSLAFIFLSLGIFFRLSAGLALLLSLAFSVFLYLRSRGEAKKIIPAVLLSFGMIIMYLILNYYLYARLIVLNPRTPNFSPQSFFYLIPGLFILFGLAIFLSKDYQQAKESQWEIEFLPVLLILTLASVPSRDRVNSTMNLFFSSFPLIALLFLDFSTNIKQFFSKNLGIKQVFFLTMLFFLLLVALGLREKPHQALLTLLPLVPLTFIFLCLYRQQITGNRGIRAIILLLIFISFIFNLNYLKSNILKYKFYNASRYTFIQEHTKENDIIIFTHPILLEHAGPLFFERIYLVCDAPERTDALIDKFLKKGIAHFYIWASSREYADYFSKQYSNYKVLHTSVFSHQYAKGDYYLFEMMKNL